MNDGAYRRVITHTSSLTQGELPVSDTRKISISTAWEGLRYASAEESVNGFRQIGFQALELSVFTTVPFLKDIERLVKQGEIAVSSLHNFCPVPRGIAPVDAPWKVPLLSTTNKRTRQSAIEMTKTTIDWASRLNASAVVLHMGKVGENEEQRGDAIKLMGAGYEDQARGIIARELQTRALRCKPYWENAFSALQELAPYAKNNGIKLGIENRYFHTEIPSLDELQTIFDAFDESVVGYWHDTGHAHTQEFLQVVEPGENLRRFGSRLIGMHAHNAIGASDHRPIPRGEMDFAEIMPFAPCDAWIVLEIHRATDEELIRSRTMLENL